MKLHRISVKYFVEDADSVDIDLFIPIFHSWIQQQKISDHLLFDVADYKHVPQGPGVILIAHEADFGYDLTGGRTGLLYTRKQNGGSNLRNQLRTVFRKAIKACQLIEAEPALTGAASFRTDEAQLTFLDRLRAPNTAEAFAALSADIEAVLAEIHPGITVTLEQVSTDPRHPLSVRIQALGAASLAGQLARLEHVHA
jgi:hypothetical protein